MVDKNLYKDIIIGHNDKRLSCIKYPEYSKMIGNEYDTLNTVCFETMYKDLQINVSDTYAVLDGFDLSYQGYINGYDILEYEIEHNIQ